MEKIISSTQRGGRKKRNGSEQIELDFSKDSECPVQEPDPSNSEQSVSDYYAQLVQFNKQNGTYPDDKDLGLLRNQIFAKPDPDGKYFDGEDPPVRFRKPRRKK